MKGSTLGLLGYFTLGLWITSTYGSLQISAKQTEEWLKGFREYEIVVPQRLDPHGNLYPHHQHYLHKRSTSITSPSTTSPSITSPSTAAAENITSSAAASESNQSITSSNSSPTTLSFESGSAANSSSTSWIDSSSSLLGRLIKESSTIYSDNNNNTSDNNNFNNVDRSENNVEDINDANDPPGADADNSPLVYVVRAFGRTLELELLRDDGLTAPQVLFEEYGEQGGQAHYKDRGEFNAHCFHRGHVRGDKNSDVALSLCHNMMGSIRTSHQHYLIEPLPNSTVSTTSTTTTSGHHEPVQHVIYKLHHRFLHPQHSHSNNNNSSSSTSSSSSPSSSSSISSPCGMDANYKHERWKDPTVAEDAVNGRHGDQRQRRRRKRSTINSWQRHVEVMVVADKKMADFHGSDLHDYLFVIMSIVASIYRDPSIGNSINIVVVKVHVLKDERAGLDISANAHYTLTNFCRYQRKINDLDDTSPQHHDTAVLVTRHDLCRAQNACDTLGLAELGTMCDINRSCSIAEDNGLSTAFTIAHELGHVFNLKHDDEDECLQNFPQQSKEQSKVMASTLDHLVDVYAWSQCSNKTMTDFLDDGYGDCLLDKPVQTSFANKVGRLRDVRPGQIYNVNQQCEQAFGKGYRNCPYMPKNGYSSVRGDGGGRGCDLAASTSTIPEHKTLKTAGTRRAKCERLWCQNSAINNAQCITQHMRWGEGTRCSSEDPNMWCQHGLCVPQYRPKPVDGSWSPWNSFGSCSRTCGGGVKRSERYCTHPAPQHGGEYCVGKRVRYKSCSTMDCPPGSKDFREVQCADLDRKHLSINGIPQDGTWVPKYEGVKERDRCKLFCKMVNKGGKNIMSFFPPVSKVIDGTKCGAFTSDICVAGHCQQAGCDNHLGSRMKRDKCGKCGGDNSSCRNVQQSYNEVRYGYHGNFTIPAGALNIDIRQRAYTDTSSDDTYLALKVPSGAGERWILNGVVEQRGKNGEIHRHKMVTPFRKTILVNTTLIEYSGSNSVEERINITQRITEPLELLVLSVGELYPPGVKWSYLISNPDSGFVWSDKGPWRRCSHICQGQRTRQVVCVSVDDGRMVSDQRCEADTTITKPKEISRACNPHCKLKWDIEVGECSAACGVGSLRRKIKCRKIILRRGHVDKFVNEGHCALIEARPPDRLRCRGQCQNTHWSYSEWSKCSKSCARGVQYRTAQCQDQNKQKVNISLCSTANKYVVQRCNEEKCPTWETSDWTGCSVSCGSGWRLRQVSCKQNGNSVSKTLCPRDAEPQTRTPCTNPACPVWHHGNWGQCSTSCGEGLKRRAVKCRLDSGIILKDEECDLATRPRFQTTCNPAACPDSTPATVPMVTAETTESEEEVTTAVQTQWRTGSWTQCSASCGAGTRQRYVSCRDLEGAIADDTACTHTPRPPEREQCKLRVCGMWRTGEWTQCSVTCGHGMETRQVACVTLGGDDQRAAPEYCDMSVQPAAEQACNKQLCISAADLDIATITSNSVCSSTCEGGWQQRAVVCQDETGHSDQCDRAQKPPHITACNSGPCPRWNYGGWGQCSVTCGGGTRQRVIRCQLPNAHILPDTSCDLLQRPRHHELCNIASCPGSGNSGNSVHDNESTTPRGKGRKRNRESIFKQHYPYWAKGPWSEWYKQRYRAQSGLGNITIITAPLPYEERRKDNSTACSVSCGGAGTRTRHVACTHRNGTLDDTATAAHCGGQRKPRMRRKCRRAKCPRWVTTKWSQCSASCGVGIRKREIRCVESRRRQVHDERCVGLVAPRDTEFCELRECTKYQWKTGDWGQCSANCGNGRKIRQVECIDTEHNHSVNASLCADKDRPKRKRRCSNNSCPYMWVEGDWNQCSESCGAGVQYRDVSCRAVTREGWILPGEVDGCDVRDKPLGTKLCNHGDCNALFHWVAGAWGECSRDCGIGRAKRKVQCIGINGERHHGSNCVARFKPPKTKSCYQSPCYASTCAELKKLMSLRADGEYSLMVDGRLIQIYCRRMRKRRPQEYLSLPAGDNENYSQVYKRRLNDHTTCPANGTRVTASSCKDCMKSSYPRAGFTSFSRVRLNITSMTVVLDDFKFSRSSRGSKRVAYASAGDCYSSEQCPQGEFKLNLRGTGLRMRDSVGWFSSGHRSSRRILTDKNRQVVDGKCGGHCGHCAPNLLQLELLPTH